MAPVLVDITILGKGIVRFASGSMYVISRASDWARTSAGVYDNAYDLKFFMNGNLKKIFINQTNTATIRSSSIDRSFTVSAASTTASMTVVFEPNIQNNNIILKKNGVSTGTLTYTSLDAMTTSTIPVDFFMSNPTKVGAAQTGANTPTDKDYARGYMFRYLYRQANNDKDLVKEVSENQYNSVSSFYLYKAIRIKWKIIGDKEKTSSINSNIADQAEKELKGAKSLLIRNPLLYWKNLPDVVETFDVTQKVIQTGGQ